MSTLCLDSPLTDTPPAIDGRMSFAAGILGVGLRIVIVVLW